MKMRSLVFVAAAVSVLCAAPWSVKVGESTSLALTTANAAELAATPRAYRRSHARYYRSAYYDPFCGGPYVGGGWNGGSYWGGPWMDLRCYGVGW